MSIRKEERRAWAAYKAAFSNPSLSHFRDHYSGTFASRDAYANHYLVQVERLPSKLSRWFNFAQWVEDAEAARDIRIVEDSDVIHVFDL